MARTTGPTTEGYALFGDADALSTVEGRLRQLEGEQFGQLMLAQEADAVGDKNAAEAHRGEADKLARRMSTTRATRDRIKAAVDAAKPADDDTTPAAT